MHCCTGLALQTHHRCNSNICDCCSLRLKQRRPTGGEADCMRTSPSTSKCSLPGDEEGGKFVVALPASTCARILCVPVLWEHHSMPSTVLAQDHFCSDFLSLHATNKSLNSSMMMKSKPRFPHGSVPRGACFAGLMIHLGSGQAEWLNCVRAFVNRGLPFCVVLLGRAVK